MLGILLNRALMQTFMNQLISLVCFLQGLLIPCKGHNTPSGYGRFARLNCAACPHDGQEEAQTVVYATKSTNPV